MLEAGCGEGYGADLLTGSASTVLALDLDAPTTSHVAARYPRVRVGRADLAALPVRDGSCDVVVSLQVVEHLREQERFLQECFRVLRPGGALRVSTPNRLTFSPGRESPLNPFHTRELAGGELAGLVTDAGFVDLEVLGLHHGPRLRALDARHGGSVVDAQIAVARRGRGMVRSPAGRRRGGVRRGLRAARAQRRREPGPGRTRRAAVTPPAVGTFCLVLHSHLPWLAHHGRWPVGEEWLYQCWAHAYLPVLDVVRRLSGEGRHDLLTLGVTPVLAAQLDDPHCLRGAHHWIGDWLLRAHAAAGNPELAAYEHRRATAALELFEIHWRHGASPGLRALADAGAVELLGGPATHPFGPLLRPEIGAFALEAGLEDATIRLGARPTGIWAPECGYAPGMEAGYAAAGVERFLVDGPAMHGDTGLARPVGTSDVVAFGRDLDVSYRVWSPRSGYPGGRDYRDFHTVDHASGLKPARVTGRSVPPPDKRPYDPDRAAAAVARDAVDFVTVVRERLVGLRERLGRPALDRRGFRHRAVRALVARGAGLAGGGAAGAARRGGAGDDAARGRRRRPRGPTGRPAAVVVGIGQGLAGLGGRAGGRPRRPQRCRAGGGAAQRHARPVARPATRCATRSRRQALLALASDWAFMVTTGSAVDYARGRAHGHAERVEELAGLLTAGRRDAAARRIRTWPPQPFGHIDARALTPGPSSTNSW